MPGKDVCLFCYKEMSGEENNDDTESENIMQELHHVHCPLGCLTLVSGYAGMEYSRVCGTACRWRHDIVIRGEEAVIVLDEAFCLLLESRVFLE